VGNADRKKLYEAVTRQQWDATERRVSEVMTRLDGARMGRPDAGVIGEEYRNAARMLVHGCQRGRWLLDKSAEDAVELAAGMREIIGHHRRLWLARNRVGGLQDSTGRLEARLKEYQC
jgi:hypothetical protein